MLQESLANAKERTRQQCAMCVSVYWRPLAKKSTANQCN